MVKKIFIPEHEYQERINRASKLVKDNDLDVLIVNSNEADYANARYFSGFWPIFERAGVAITPTGEAALMVGPESKEFAYDFSKIDKIYTLMEYRESADPSYPEIKPDSFKDVFKGIGLKGTKLKIGVASLLDTSVVIMEGLKQSFPDAEIVKADHIMVELRRIKSDNEISCIKEGLRITEIAMQDVLNNIKPGMTELEVVGIAQNSIYKNGAEYEGLPMYVFSEKSTSHAISRPTHKIIEKGDIVQLNLAAKVDGYSPSIGMPISLGKLSEERKRIVDFGLEAHNWTRNHLKPGVKASEVAKGFYDFFKDNGFEDNYLYGPCHGTGLIEVEAPWIETDSEFLLEPNMTFQIDTFLSAENFGIRWENGVAIREEGCESLSNPLKKIHELVF